jgi:hypothetical protein
MDMGHLKLASLSSSLVMNITPSAIEGQWLLKVEHFE